MVVVRSKGQERERERIQENRLGESESETCTERKRGVREIQ